MQDFIITDINNDKETLIKVQKKLFKMNIYWPDQNPFDFKEKLEVHNNDNNLIFIIQNNKISWTNKKYGYSNKYKEFKKLNLEDFLKEGAF